MATLASQLAQNELNHSLVSVRDGRRRWRAPSHLLVVIPFEQLCKGYRERKSLAIDFVQNRFEQALLVAVTIGTVTRPSSLLDYSPFSVVSVERCRSDTGTMLANAGRLD